MGIPRASVTRVKEEADGLEFRLRAISTRLANPQPALLEITEEFSLMEATRFASGGAAPEFGISSKWKKLSPGNGDGTNSTVANRARAGGNPKNQPLVNFGYLANAAIDPKIEPFGAHSLNMIIDPSNRAPAGYSRGHNYGLNHQDGDGVPQRKFVTITPEFRLIAKAIVERYILADVKTKKKATGITPADSNRIKAAKEHRKKLRAKATLSDKKHGSITKVEHFGTGNLRRAETTIDFKATTKAANDAAKAARRKK